MSGAAAKIQTPFVNRARDPLRVLGTTVTQVDALKKAAIEDLGDRFEFISLDGTASQRRGALYPDTFDVYDQWFHDIDLIWPTGSIRAIDVTRIQRWDQIERLPASTMVGGTPLSAPGSDPSQRLFVQLDGTLGSRETRQISMVPTVHNADSFAVIGSDPGEIRSWGALLDPKWAGAVVLQTDAAIGSLDMLLALHATGELVAGDAGDLSLEEIDALVDRLHAYRAAGHFRCLWADEAQAIEAFGEGQRAIGSLWWSGFTKLRARGIPVNMVTPDFGYRGWFGGLALSVKADAWAVDAAYDYINWWFDGRAGALMSRNGAYMTGRAAVRKYLSQEEWEFWYRGTTAACDIRDADGTIVFSKGERREGGAYEQRMSRVAVWDTVMKEHNYLVRRWENVLNR
ncbi:ABC transporter substrate-binding protein [Pseudohoeflea coraliihabitans]|uniref:Extracellular solute-binding protein n=1 Tax=Pseudohoeflea coraliihabitans TaxID=2860393 RepID=A0ABS6WPC6_9HYPH|nr:extracellular solute-binding protein [Pseudohoeflea sp. DP4N28-3]MBW3097819.1 extracellular solute-binding protein [Pseudohoeflea sp. DP4N28-3]